MTPVLHLGLDREWSRPYRARALAALSGLSRGAELASGRGARVVPLPSVGALEFRAGMFRSRADEGWSEDALRSLLEVLADANGEVVRGLPPLYESGVRYEAEPPGEENWRVAPLVAESGRGDCEDLAAWRVAELRGGGEPAEFDVLRQELGAGELLYHISVLRGDGSVEDPSALLGMRAPRGQKEARP